MSDQQRAEQTASGHPPAPAFEATGLTAALTVNNLDASVEWYTHVLGFAAERSFERDGVRLAVRVRAGSVLLLLNQDNGAKGSDRKKGEGLSLQLTTKQNIDELAARAKANGATLDAEPIDAMGARVFRLHDPDGFRLVISSERDWG